jgi:voltage-gated potassium channel
VLRSLATTVALVALYYLLPLDRLASVRLAVILVVGLLVLLAVAAWQLRLVIGRGIRPCGAARP